MPPENLTLTFSGTIPQTGLYYGWTNTTQGIDSLTAAQTGAQTITLMVSFKPPSSLPAGTYQDTILVAAATDPDGYHMIAGSPQSIPVAYAVLHPAPGIAALNPSSAWVGQSSFTLTVSGGGFPEDAQVRWNGDPVPTTRLSSTALAASIDATLLARQGTAQITVTGADRMPSSPATFPVDNAQARVLPYVVNDMAWDRVNQLLFVGTNYSGTELPSSILAVEPATGRVLAAIPVGRGAGHTLATNLAISDDGSFLYAYVTDFGRGAAIQRFSLPSLVQDDAYSVDLGQESATGRNYFVASMGVAPGTPRTLAVLRWSGAGQGGVVVLDDAVQRGPAVLDDLPGAHAFMSMEWRDDGSALFLSDPLTGDVVTVAVGGGGPSVQNTFPQVLGASALSSPRGLHWLPSSGRLYLDDGRILDPSTGRLAGSCGSGWSALALDPDLGRGYFLDLRDAVQETVYLPRVHAFDLARGIDLGTTSIPILRSLEVGFYPQRILRCGPAALALTGNQRLCLVTGPFAQ